jgi:hypothetical protein
MKFIETLKLHYDKAPVDSIIRLREQIVYEGKHSPKILEVAQAKGLTDDPKYYNPDNMCETGAIENHDAILLYAIVAAIRPKLALDIGTWFGTSAVVIGGNEGTVVYTCDRNDVYVANNENNRNVEYYNSISTKWLKFLIRKKTKAQFAFIDANLKDDDPALLRKVLVFNSPIALHDFEGNKKGVRNWKRLRRIFKELELIEPRELPGGTKCMALMAPRDGV